MMTPEKYKKPRAERNEKLFPAGTYKICAHRILAQFGHLASHPSSIGSGSTTEEYWGAELLDRRSSPEDIQLLLDRCSPKNSSCSSSVPQSRHRNFL